MIGTRCIAVSLLTLAAACAATAEAADYTKPKVRAITAFVNLERASYARQIAATLVVLREAQRDFESRGYTVESVRITTQPLAELVRGQSETQALAYLKELDDLAAKENFLPNIGPAMLRDGDDPHTMQLRRRR